MLAIRNAFSPLAASLVAVLVSTSIAVQAQDSATGTIRGTVVDPSGARVSQALVVVVNSGTGVRYTATSDSEGHFAFDVLPPGDYSARLEAPGMSPQVTPQMHVDVRD
ncbi:MAG TPA: carboxypeptidase-like regulatory domain-containing protein [Candidatus Sulfotelmatobacter sp.]|nr:carboxypeptidase-like regulatory domain-containing protein [Candidatus Sulfotelmatobacter sp.]